MIRLAITGAEGFIGGHLLNYLRLFPKEFELSPIEDDTFKNPLALIEALKDKEVIVHLAALNRHPVQEEVNRVNRQITDALLEALEQLDTKPYIVFASSTQEGNGTVYGESKLATRNRFVKWSKENKASFLGLIIPNVFGPFGTPYYHSVMSTFCHQIIHGDEPRIIENKLLDWIYVDSLSERIRNLIKQGLSNPRLIISPDGQTTVLEMLEKMKRFNTEYRLNLQIPELKSMLDQHFFNTFRSYIPLQKYPFKLTLHSDDRGTLAEMIRSGTKGQVFYSTTKPGITRGNHFHLRKVERFCVIKGKASIKLRRIGTKEVIDIQVNGKQPSVVDMPVWYTHNITNVGDDELITLFWSNEFFDPEDADTWYEEV